MTTALNFARGFFGSVASSSSSSGGGQVLGPRLAYASPAGGAVAAAPPGFVASLGPTGTGRLIVSTAAGDATWASFAPAGADGQLLEIINAGPNNLTLPAAVFLGNGDLFLPPNNRVLTYYDSTDVSWERTAP